MASSPYLRGFPTSVEWAELALEVTTSEPQAGQWNTLPGRWRISGWPHSHACSPKASGRATICSRVRRTAPSTPQPQESHSAESCPRASSSPRPHSGQTTKSRPDVTRDGTFIYLLLLHHPSSALRHERNPIVDPRRDRSV